MSKQTNKPLHLPLLVGGIAAILVSGIAIGSLAISAESFNGIVASGEPREEAAAPAIAAPGARAYSCAECGMIESMREIEVPDESIGVNAPGESYEITIRLQDGSMRVIIDANPTRWRHGDRVTVIAAVD
jgi:hypothetical protein